VQPADPSRCAFPAGAVAHGFPTSIALDGSDVYWIDFDSDIYVSPLSGGPPLLVATLGEWLPLAVELDETSLYIAAIPFEAIFDPVPGAILVVPKSGGEPEVLVSDVMFPWDLALDATHVYWASLGTLDFSGGSLRSDGSVGRARKDGTGRQNLATDLSGPADVALVGDDVFFGQTGFADDDPTMGLYRVAKEGGGIHGLIDDLAVLGLAAADDALVLLAGDPTTLAVGLFRSSLDGTQVLQLVVDEEISAPPRVIDGRAYYISGGDDETPGTLRWVSIADPGTPVDVVSALFTGPDFEVDACSVVFGVADPEALRRIPRN
jgi:hypothetical protein